MFLRWGEILCFEYSLSDCLARFHCAELLLVLLVQGFLRMAMSTIHPHLPNLFETASYGEPSDRQKELKSSASTEAKFRYPISQHLFPPAEILCRSSSAALLHDRILYLKVSSHRVFVLYSVVQQHTWCMRAAVVCLWVRKVGFLTGWCCVVLQGGLVVVNSMRVRALLGEWRRAFHEQVCFSLWRFTQSARRVHVGLSEKT